MTPHVTIIGNGPSAHLFGKTADRDSTIIAVNWAAEQVAADVWCFVDWDTFATKTPGLLGKPDIFCGCEVVPKLREQAPELLPRFFSHNVGIYCSRPCDGCVPYWGHKSGLVALAYVLRHAEVESIDLYGYDMCGKLDCRGDTNKFFRDESRWVVEREVFARLAGEAKRAGIAITRYCEDGETRHELQAVETVCG